MSQQPKSSGMRRRAMLQLWPLATGCAVGASQGANTPIGKNSTRSEVSEYIKEFEAQRADSRAAERMRNPSL